MIEEVFLADIIQAFRNYKKLADEAIAQISGDEFFRQIDEESNSLATIVKHLGGNLRSRWTRFLTTDGEKPDRNRDLEFVALENETKENLLEFWENGWQALFGTLESLSAEDLEKHVTIRGEDYTVVKAINRALAHAAYHVGQIVFLAKHFRAAEWQNLSIPRNKSAEFNSFLAEQKEQKNPLESARDFAEKIKNEVSEK